MLLSQGNVGATLYLWQNERTVVIGRNQNAWRECRAERLESEGGKLARRTTGGGAVFHDLGNLNFSLIVPRADYDLARQLSVVRNAVESFGIKTAFSGRNDLILAKTSAKFSGNAFRHEKNASLHHGTLLVGADMERLSRYLAPSPQKLAAKGVKSVLSRVENLSAHATDLTIEALSSALTRSFMAEYGDGETIAEDVFSARAIAEATERFSSRAWIYGRTPAFDATFSHRFDWGETELLLSVERGCVSAAKLYTDAMDASLAKRVEGALVGTPYDAVALSERLFSMGGAQETDLGVFLQDERL